MSWDLDNQAKVDGFVVGYLLDLCYIHPWGNKVQSKVELGESAKAKGDLRFFSILRWQVPP